MAYATPRPASCSLAVPTSAPVSKLLGHSSIAIAADVYAHMIAAVGQRAVDGATALVVLTVHSQPGVSPDVGLCLGG
jgi:hypothetical protein